MSEYPYGVYPSYLYTWKSFLVALDKMTTDEIGPGKINVVATPHDSLPTGPSYINAPILQAPGIGFISEKKIQHIMAW